MVSTAPSKTMELEGNLKAFQLSDILRFLALGKMSGVLSFINKENVIELCFKEGALIGTCSPERFPRLGQMLVYNGLLTRKGLEETLDAQRDGHSDKMFGELLIERGLATQEQIESALRLQIREQLWDLFSWNDGTFKFEHGLRGQSERFIVTLEIEPLIEEGFQHLEQWRTINANLGDPDLVFRVTRILDGLPEAKLTPTAWRILALINGRHSLQVLIFLSGLGRFETLCALDRLIGLQLIEVVPVKHRPIPGGRPGDYSGSNAAPRRPVEPEPADAGDEDEPEARGRGLFGMLRRAPRKEVTPEPTAAPIRAGSHLTSVGLACSMINRLAARLCSEPDFRIEGGLPALVEGLWTEIGMRFPRADLIAVRQGELNPAAYEAYVKLAGGVSDCLAGCHEDSMETLALIAKRLARLARERLGDRARRVVMDTIRPYLDSAEIRYAADFMPRSWAEQWTEVLN